MGWTSCAASPALSAASLASLRFLFALRRWLKREPFRGITMNTASSHTDWRISKGFSPEPFNKFLGPLSDGAPRRASIYGLQYLLTQLVVTE